ncbi:MAG: 4Fe-4S dicluster domain-containing protein [Actinomycetota bacterium]|nr:4Fe-4S dicluster domain-containing protein [Actinomycetota bacterium]
MNDEPQPPIAGKDGPPAATETQSEPRETSGPARIERRSFLGRAVVGGVGVTALGALAERLFATPAPAGASPTKAGSSAQTARSSGQADHQWAMVIDLRYCNGCKLCTAACQAAHYLRPEQTWIDVFTMRTAENKTYSMPRPCMMCEDPPCVPVCPVSANVRTSDGLTLVDQSRCIGTRICMNACPYEARYFNWSDPRSVPRQPFPQEPEWPVPQQKGTVGKCIFCAAMLPSGQVPECVANCPMGVLYLGDIVRDVAVNGLGNTVTLSTFLEENDAVRFKESYGTSPRVWYILGHGQDLESDTSAS